MSEKKLSEYNIMNKKELKKLSKSQLIDRLMKLEKLMKPENKKPEVIIVDDTKPVPASRNFIIPPNSEIEDPFQNLVKVLKV